MAVVTDPRRVRVLRDGLPGPGAVVYWMQRDQRVADNWALLHAQELALARRVPLGVVFCLVPRFLDAGHRQYAFMLAGLREVESGLSRLGIGFFLLTGDPPRVIPRFVREQGAGTLVTDFMPLRIVRGWQTDVGRRLRVPLVQVDAHNIVPCWEASPKLEFAARTIRPKIGARLREFLVDFPRLRRHPHPWPAPAAATNWDAAARTLRPTRGVAEIVRIAPGARAARRRLSEFIRRRLPGYAADRNDPNRDVLSGLSPYLHFGQLAAQRVAL